MQEEGTNMETIAALLLCLASLSFATPLKPEVSEDFGNPWLHPAVKEKSGPGGNIVPPSHECMQAFNTLRKEWWKGIHATSLHDFLDSRQGKMSDAIGKPPANILSGKLEWLGSRDECLGIQGMQYCVMPMHVDNVKTVGKFGVCLPKECSTMDAVGFVQSTIVLYMRTVYYMAGFFFPGDHITFDETAKEVICVSNM